MLRLLSSNWRVTVAAASSVSAFGGIALSDSEPLGHETVGTHAARAPSGRRSVAARLASLEARMARFAGPDPAPKASGRGQANRLVAESFNSGFPAAHDTYNSVHTEYYVYV